VEATATGAPATATPVVIDFWSTAQQPARLAVYAELAVRFTSMHPGFTIRITPPDEATVGLASRAAGWLQGRAEGLVNR
jgi:ABC-type glycerol-3-phosphate transport system substrate-binding protein